jgi:hypothetical protein
MDDYISAFWWKLAAVDESDSKYVERPENVMKKS